MTKMTKIECSNLSLLTKNPGRHEQVGTPFITSHFVLTPHGLGEHSSAENFNYLYSPVFSLIKYYKSSLSVTDQPGVEDTYGFMC